ncbi:energy-coupling factor transporter transmembrane protein EcfT [Rhizobium sp. KVB221]|uniref:Energy-coupling factor transporter transmembrane protein EcfT n=1 Tax=Rhizobium setariae TaxID=2801340 RepID=A0A937CQN2_9HYPH|nr:energy-coupling factor transporter transmembrane component T [Rhizobium setariae]MBL0374724.1 energy-coupling factor transporter transmembrane protein EcfT [Rhizobium setariae]
MLTLTSPFETRFHRVPAGAKLAALTVATLIVMPLSQPWPILLAATIAAALYLSEGPRFSIHGLRMLRPLWPFLAVLVLWHGFSGGWQPTEVWAGAAIGIKMLTAVALANLVTMTTRLDQMIAVLERVASPLRHVGLSPRVLAVSIALVIRFVPVLMGRAGQIAESWRARSSSRPNWRIVAPVTLAAIDEAEQIAEALRARGGI